MCKLFLIKCEEINDQCEFSFAFRYDSYDVDTWVPWTQPDTWVKYTGQSRGHMSDLSHMYTGIDSCFQSNPRYMLRKIDEYKWAFKKRIVIYYAIVH